MCFLGLCGVFLEFVFFFNKFYICVFWIFWCVFWACVVFFLEFVFFLLNKFYICVFGF